MNLFSELQEAFIMHCSADNTISLDKLGAVVRSIGRAPTESQLQTLQKEFESRGDAFRRLPTAHIFTLHLWLYDHLFNFT